MGAHLIFTMRVVNLYKEINVIAYHLWQHTTSDGIPPLTAYHLWQHTTWQHTTSDSITPLTTCHLWQHTTSDSIPPLTAYDLWQHTTSNSITHLTTYHLWQHNTSDSIPLCHISLQIIFYISPQSFALGVNTLRQSRKMWTYSLNIGLQF